ncbi:hypothetical protein [Polaromonas sp. YR568]|uniref:hypothetical protein n=1 Tax=Polaromonas sp. YR568 TaxID=1855301 RepID=UPI00398C029F
MSSIQKNSNSNGTSPIREVKVSIPRIVLEQPDAHPLGKAIETFVSRSMDIAWACSIAVPNAQTAQLRLLRKIARQQKNLLEQITSSSGTKQAEATAAMLDNDRNIDLIANSKMPSTIVAGLFIGLFCEFDNFVGEFIRGVAHLDETRFYHLKREVTIGELKGLATIDELRDDLLEKDIESLRRESYPKQFQQLEKDYDLQLTKFDEWPSFVEASQRRNLFTHAGGVTSDQYRQVCLANGNLEKDIPPKGTLLPLDPTYFFAAHKAVERTGVMLGYTLWRKIFPRDPDIADRHLNELIYNRLRLEDFATALRFSNFGLSQPFVKPTSGVMRRMRIVNKAIALKRLNRGAEAISTLDGEDWSGTVRDFSLAQAVLRDNYAEAAALMRKIGKEGEFVTDGGYRNWPLFWHFRKSEEFLKAYKDVFGYSFSETVTSEVRDSEAGTTSPKPAAKKAQGKHQPVARTGKKEPGVTKTTTRKKTTVRKDAIVEKKKSHETKGRTATPDKKRIHRPVRDKRSRSTS